MRLWRLSRDQLRPVALTLGQSFLVGLPRVFTATAASALFLTHFKASELPYAYLLGGVLLSAIGIVYVRTERRWGVAAGIGAFLALAAVLLTCRLELGVGAQAVAFALILLSEIEFTLTNITFWSLANRVFSAREAGRAFGLISAGEVLPSILGGLLIPTLVRAVGVENLLYLSAAGHLVSAGYLGLARHLLRDRYATAETGADAAGGPEPERRSLRALFKGRYLALIAASVWLNLFVFYFVDNTFYGAAQSQYADPTQLASFIGGFFVALGVCNLLFKTLLSGRWRAWFGMRVALLTTPASFAVACLLVLLAPLFTDDPARLFACIVVLKLIERVFIEGVFNPTYYALFQPLPVSVRTAAQNTIETTVAQVATLIAGGVLLLLEHHEGAVVAADLLTATLAVSVLWLGLAFVLGREYSRVLRDALGQRLVRRRDVRADLGAMAALLQQALRSESLGQVLYTLQLLRGLDVRPVEKALLSLLDYPNPEVVESAAQLLLRSSPRHLGTALLQRLSRSDAPPSLVSAWIRSLALAAPEGWERSLAAKLKSPLPQVRAAAAGALSRGAEAARRLADPVIDAMCRSADPEERSAAAGALGGTDAAFAAPLRALLADPVVSVRREAIRSAARSRQATLWPQVIAALAEPSLRATAADALVQGGPAVLPFVAGALAGAGRPVQAALLDVAARVDPEAALALLQPVLEGADRPLALLAVEALGRRGHRAPAALTPQLKALLADAYERHRGLTHERTGWTDAPEAALLLSALDDELAELELSILSLLSLLYDPTLRTVLKRLQMGDASELSVSLEYLESALPPEELARATPVFDPLEREASARRAPERPHASLVSRLTPLIAGSAPFVTPWIRACAVELAHAKGFTGSAREQAYLVERVRALQQVALFRHTRGARLQGLAARCDERFLHPGEELLGRGQPSASLFVVLEGELEAGGEAPARPGAGINPLAALEPSRSPVQVRALSASRVLEVRSEELLAQLEQDFEFAQRLLVNLCELSRTGPLHAVSAREPGARGALPDPPNTAAERMLALNSVALFRGMDDGVLGALAAHAEERHFKPGEDMVVRGELGTRMFVLFEGQARVHRTEHTLAEIDAPTVFGEGAAIAPAPRDASVSAVTPCRVLVLEREVLFELMREQPMVVRRMQQVLLKRALGAERLNVTVSDHVDFVASLIG